MDPRLAEALQKFARNEISAFKRPAGSRLATLDPDAPLTFSRLCTYLAVSRTGIPVTSYEDAVTEGLDDCGLDGLAVALGDEPLADPETAEALAESSVHLMEQGSLPPRPRVLFVQSKRTSHCSNNEVKLFGVDALDFLTMRPRHFRDQKPNPAVLRWWTIYHRIREVFDRHRLPLVVEADLVFAFTGLWSEEKTRAESSRQSAEERLRERLGHPHARFTLWGAEEIAGALLLSVPAVTHVLRGASLVPLPPAPARGYLGHAPAASVLALLPERAGALEESVFTENVRSYLGLESTKNPGAAGLAQTLDSGCGDEVILRHNGITIVARDARMNQNELELIEYQIVNGAQTAHVLHEKRDKLKDVHLAVKVVITGDDALKNEVIRGANTQSPVDDYDMLSRLPFLRGLQEHLHGFDPAHPERLWLQRRRAEPLLERDYDPHRVITPRQLLETFTATLLGAPHAVHAHSASCLDHVRQEQIFAPTHSFTVYRALGCLLAAARQWAARQSSVRWIDQGDFPGSSSAYPARFQFLYALWLLADPGPEGSHLLAGSPAVEHRFAAVCRKLTDPKESLSLANRAGTLVRSLLHRGSRSPQVRRVAFTERLRQQIAGKSKRPPKSAARESGPRLPRRSLRH